MAKRKTKAKRSMASLPKGLPSKRSDVNPFEVTKRQRRPKHDVLNRFSSNHMQKKPSKLAESLQRRQAQLRATLQSSKKVNTFVDRRIGEYNMSQEDRMVARVVQERTRRSKRTSKFSLNEDEDQELTHKGKSIDQSNHADHVILDSDEEDGGNLDAVDTELHFGGMSDVAELNPYGPSGGQGTDMSQVYSRRKTDLDDLIKRRRIMKAEKMQSKEQQDETFESMDAGFKELSAMLQFRDKEEERKDQLKKKRTGGLTEIDEEMNDWDKEMKTYLFERRVKATDRTKTPEEIAKEEAERLHELETRRMARMNGDFEDDALSDISDDEDAKKAKKRKAQKKPSYGGPEALDDASDVDDKDDDVLKAKFTADGLVYVDKDGKIVKKAGETEDKEEDDSSESESDDDDDNSDDDNSDDDDFDSSILLSVGAHVKGKYRANEQFDGNTTWYEGKITQVNTDKAGNISYDIEYVDGDFEEEMKPKNVRPIKKSGEEKEKEQGEKDKVVVAKRKRQKAKDKARQEIPFVFEAPTTLEALHDMVGNYASTGAEVSLIIERIHASNSVRLNRKNAEKMQNFYDVLLRRFIAVGDAMYSSGNGGDELNRYDQLNTLTKTLYAMSQDAPESAGAVWGRRLGFLQSAHAKRLRDSGFVHDEEDSSAWPSTGTVLLLRALGHIFPVTDRRHHVVTPAMIFLGQIVAQTPVMSMGDLVVGVMCSGLLIEYSKDAKRIVPEALAFLAGVLKLFSSTANSITSPSLKEMSSKNLRKASMKYKGDTCPMISFEKDDIESPSMAAAILCSTVHLVDQCIESLGGTMDGTEPEAFGAVVDALLALKPKSKKNPLPEVIGSKITNTASKLSEFMSTSRQPLTRRSGPTRQDLAIKSLAPRLEDPTRYTMSKDVGKTATQAMQDRSRREYKREHKAVSRELRMDGAFVEQERRRDQGARDGKARAKRNKHFGWLEGEQAAMNQQVAQGGGLLSGGGMGAARAKAKSAKMGIKKGGKF